MQVRLPGREELAQALHAREMHHAWGDKGYGCNHCREMYRYRADAIIAILTDGTPDTPLPTPEHIAELLYVNDRTPGQHAVPRWDRAYPITRRPYLALAEKVLALFPSGATE